MKKLLFLLFTLAFTSATYAEKVTEQQALQKAQQFMQGKQFIQKKLRRAPSKNVESKAYYVFNVENNGGFVIVAGDDRMTEILGYSETGNVNLDSIPEQMKWLLDGYQTIYRKLSTSTDNTPKARRTTRANIEPLISTEWGQENPYNEMCPMHGTNRSITGCVSTAMAQVINYCRWPEGQTASVPAYTTETYQISVPALEPTQFNWEYMGIKQVARLMRYCGQSVKMDYGLAASGAALNLVPDALINIFGYSESAQCVSCGSEYSDEEWENLLYEEIAAKRAVILAGMGYASGHAFIAHGYKDGLFRINWGWTGQQDGYFALTNLASAGGDYSLYQNAVIGIQPPSGPPTVAQPIIEVSTDIMDWNTEWRTVYYQKGNDGKFPSFNVKEKITNSKPENIEVSIGYGLYGDQGLVEVLQQENHSFEVSGDYWHQATLTISNSVGNGEYYIVPISKDKSSDDWLPDVGSTSAFVRAMISGNLLKLTNYPLYSNEQREEYGIHTIDGITYELLNQMGSFRAMVLPHKDGKYSGSISIPDEVGYEGLSFKVYDALDLTFSNCSELTSISTAMTYVPRIINCTKLSNLELREGVVESIMVESCPLLESIEYPSTTTLVHFTPRYCNNLKVIKFKNPDKVEFGMFNIYSPSIDLSSSLLPALTDVYFYSATPPALKGGDNGYTVTSKATIHIPIGTMASYKNSILKNCNLVEDLETPFTGVNWSYCLSDKTTMDFAQHCNTLLRNNIEFAIHVPSDMVTPYTNQKITSIQYYTPVNITTDAPNYVFITKPGTDYLVKQETTETIEGQWVNVKLQEPLTITGDELFVGVGQVANFCVYFTDMDVQEMDGFWMREMGPDMNYNFDTDLAPGTWMNQAERFPNWAHPIAVRFVIEGEDFPNDLKICNVLGTEKDGKPVLTATVVNRSPELVKTYSINWTIDDKETGTKIIETSMIPNGHEEMILDLPSSITATRSHVIKFEVTAINGKEDGVPANSNIGFEFSLPVTSAYSRRIVMEEVSGTWCGYTPRAIETMRQMQKHYPDNFIAIAIHCNGEDLYGTEQMADADNYQHILNKFDSYPSSLICRQTKMDPNLPETEDYTTANKSNAVATMNLSVSTDAEDASKVIVKTDTRFGFNDEVEGRYRYAYVVLEDGVGPYVQSNNYYNQSEMSAPDDYLNAWTKLGDKVEMLHDNVARGIYPDVNGVNGSVPASIKKGQSYNYEYSLTLPTNVLNKDNVRIVAMLIDSWTGEIINAADCKIGESSKNIEIVPITETEEISFKDSMNDNTDLSNTVIDNTYFTVNAANGDGYDATEQAIVLNSTTTTEQMNTVQNAQVGDATMQANYNGIIFEVAGSGTVTVDAKTIGTHVLNVQIGNGEPTKIVKSERGTTDVPFIVTAPTYVYLYASSTAASGAPRRAVAENSVLLYSYKVNVTVDGIEMVTYGDQENAKWYTIDGRQLPGKPTKKGLYIVNGRKVVM